MVETALVAPVLLLLLLAVFEYGLVYRGLLTVGDAAADASRAGSIQGPNLIEGGANADFSIVEATRMATATLDPATIERIIVFRAGPPENGSPLSQVPSSCRTGSSSATDACNVYRAVPAFNAVQEGDVEYFECDASGDPACGWVPTARVNGPTVAAIDYLGVYIELRHGYVTGLFGDSFTVERASISRLEPGELWG
jgi:hypothetical protein